MMDRRELSDRETQVAVLVAQGRSNGDIAGSLGVSVGTVKRYLSNVMIKWEAANRTEVGVQAVLRRLATPEAWYGGSVPADLAACPFCHQTLPTYAPESEPVEC